MLTISCIALAFIVGLLFGAGIALAGMKPERELTVQAMAKLLESQIQVQALIGATGELAQLNARILAELQPPERVPVIVIADRRESELENANRADLCRRVVRDCLGGV